MARKCMNCEEKEPARFKDWLGSMFFCSKKCRDEWNLKHPDEDVFKESNSTIKSEKKYCPECNKLIKEFWKDGVQIYKCNNRKCGL